MKKKILLINPPSSLKAYSKSKIKAAIPEIPLLSLAVLAAPLLDARHDVQILNLAISSQPDKDLEEKLKEFRPDIVGITFTTPLFAEASLIAAEIKKFDSKIVVAGGGAHATTAPDDCIKDNNFDIMAIGESDFMLVDLANGMHLKDIKGIYWREHGKIVKNAPRTLIADLDDLPMPAWQLYGDLSIYKTPRITSKMNPVGALETSRGCPFNCTYCNKKIFTQKFRYKSVKRTVDEMEYMLGLGFKEIHIWEDQFTTDLEHAKNVCREILRRGLKFPWNLFTGIRVNCVDKEFLELAKKAGCYSVSYGVESGDESILKNINKGITLAQCRKAFRMAKEAGMETIGFFMLALPGETEETMMKTIKFAVELDPDYAKFTMTLPFPGTRLYEDLEKAGKIKTHDWSLYNFHCTTEVYDHPNLSWDVIQKYYDLSYRMFYFRPKYIARRLVRGLKSGEIFTDAYYFIKTWL
ncbi:radical SAM protein [Candidatus Woesearchaeota archaeon]|nr:radical SAM protein [Candidatus Woesearchaeota archaeon]